MQKILWIFFFLFSHMSSAQIIDQIEAVVLKKPILTSDLKKFKSHLERQVLVEQVIAQVFDPEELKNDKKAQITYFKYLEIFKNHFKNNLRGRVTEEEITQKINSIAARSQINLEQFKAQLAQENINYEDYREFLKNSLQVSRVIGVEISPRVKVNDEDVLQKLKTKTSLVPSFRYQLSHIIVKGSESEALKVRDQAIKKGWNSIKLGKNVLAKAPFGSFVQGDLMENFQTALDQVDQTQITQPIAVDNKFYLLKVDKKSNIKALPNTPEITKLKAQLRQQYMLSNIKNWLKRKSSDLKI